MRSNIDNTRDSLVRFGGEEFLILLRDRTPEEAQALAERIKKQFGEVIFHYNGEDFSKTVSIGFSRFPEDADQIWRAFKCADLALYRAKETGRNKIVRFEPSMLKGGNKGDY
jgi:diguanylate cyclase (GGDEF)-like protein